LILAIVIKMGWNPRVNPASWIRIGLGWNFFTNFNTG